MLSVNKFMLQVVIEITKCDKTWQKCQRLFKIPMRNACSMFKLKNDNPFFQTLFTAMEPKPACPLKQVE